MRTSTVRRRPVISAQDPSQRRHKPDYWLIILPSALLVIGLIVVYSISPGLAVQLQNVSENHFVIKQIIAILLAITAFLIVAHVPLKKWFKWQYILVFGAVISAIAVRLFGEEIYGAYRWITLGGLSFQAVELIKLALLIWLAAFLTARKREGTLTDKNKSLKPLAVVFVVLGFVVAVMQSDLGSFGVIVVMMVAMGFVSGFPIKKLLVFGGIIAVATVLLIAPSGYRRDRVSTFLNPESDCQTTGYQACQALVAIGSGGMFGKGLAQSVQAYGYLPQAADDSIFAIYAEKFGFAGVMVLFGLFMALFARIKRVIERSPDDFSRLLAVGVLAWLSTQALINIGAMIGLIPLKGITLPFISYGGTSIIFVTMALGIVFNISRYTTYAVNHAEKPEGRRYDSTAYGRGVRRPYYAHSSRRA
jgi:cell division protein FtsW